jgi:hypothetical protein
VLGKLKAAEMAAMRAHLEGIYKQSFTECSIADAFLMVEPAVVDFVHRRQQQRVRDFFAAWHKLQYNAAVAAAIEYRRQKRLRRQVLITWYQVASVRRVLRQAEEQEQEQRCFEAAVAVEVRVAAFTQHRQQQFQGQCLSAWRGVAATAQAEKQKKAVLVKGIDVLRQADAPCPSKISAQSQGQWQGEAQVPTRDKKTAGTAAVAPATEGLSDWEFAARMQGVRSGSRPKQQQVQVVRRQQGGALSVPKQHQHQQVQVVRRQQVGALSVPKQQQQVQLVKQQQVGALSVPKQQQQPNFSIEPQSQRVRELPPTAGKHSVARMVGLDNPKGEYHCGGNALLQVFAALPDLRAIWLAANGGGGRDLLVDVVRRQLRQLLAAQQSKQRSKAKAGTGATATTEKALSTTDLRSALATVHQQCLKGVPLCASEVCKLMLERLDGVVLIEEAEQKRRVASDNSSTTSSSSSSSYVCFAKNGSCSPSHRSMLLEKNLSVAMRAKCSVCGTCRANCCYSALHVQREDVLQLAMQQYQVGGDIAFDLMKCGLQLLPNCCSTPTTTAGDCKLLMAPQVLVMVIECPKSCKDYNFISLVPQELTLPGSGRAAGREPRYQLQGLVLYYEQHFTSAELRQVAGKSDMSWLTADDALVTDVGDWQEVVEKCWLGNNHPRLLFYQRVA